MFAHIKLDIIIINRCRTFNQWIKPARDSPILIKHVLFLFFNLKLKNYGNFN